MLPILDNNTPRRRRRLKRTRPTATVAAAVIPKATLITSFLWLVAFTTTHRSDVKAFVVATDRPHTIPNTISTNKQLQPQLAPALNLAATLAEAPTSRLQDLLYNNNRKDEQEEETPEEILDLGGDHYSSPLLVRLPDTATATSASTVSTHPQDVTLLLDDEEVLEWANRYTSVEALREHFGTNQNKLWGDLQASTARRLYKTLLPRALLELSKLGKLQPQDLAPLAYQARVAAKMYARERCTVPARIAATLFDGFRQWIKYGKFQAQGMTYDQLWEKYAEKILQETEVEHSHPLHHVGMNGSFHHHHHDHHHEHDDEDDEECDPFSDDCEDLSEQVCRKILERACVSNEGVDALAFKGQPWTDETELQPAQRQLLEKIRSQLEQDMYQLLLPPDHRTSPETETDEEDEEELMPDFHTHSRDRRKRGKFRLVKTLAKQRRLWKLRKAKRELANRDKPYKRSKSWLSSSQPLDSDDDETVQESDDEEDEVEWNP